VRFLGALTVIFLCWLFPAVAATQDKPATRTVWDGVYAAEQAARGKLEYQTQCETCHGAELASGRPITGRDFLERWREDRLDPLFNYIKAAMPRGKGGSLTEAVYLDIFTYVLQRNGFPVGTESLTIAGLANIDLIGKDGPQPVPDGAVVATVGCVTRGPGNRWLLTRATEPKRNRVFYETTQEELKTAQAAPPGSLTFILEEFEAIHASAPENFEGLRMQAKGFIVRQQGAERISLFHLAMISGKCP
jgi:S-disulfanyl-L-cysteine oxidoreductase SoxD